MERLVKFITFCWDIVRMPESVLKLQRDSILAKKHPEEKIIANCVKASNDGIKKFMSKIGISTLQGAQVFEALGIDPPVITKCFFGTASRIKGVGFRLLAVDAFASHELAWPSRETVSLEVLPESEAFIGEMEERLYETLWRNRTKIN